MPNLPNLPNGRTFLSSPNEYTAGESYRERIRENISNTPRKVNENGTYTPRSIDLSIEKNLFRTVSRYNNPNSKSYDVDDDNNQLTNHRSQKSAHSRQILFYNKNHQSQDNSNNNQPQQNFDNQENLEQFLSPDNSSKYESEGSTTTENNYPNRRRRFEDNNFASKNNNLDNLNGTGNEPVFRERVQTARSRDRENATRTPVITPRKNVSYNNNINTNGNHNNNNNNNNSMNDSHMNEFNSHENANRTPRNR